MYTKIKYETINLINLVTKESLLLSESGNSYVLDGLPDWGSVTANINFVGYVNQIGSQKTSTVLESRPITISGWIVSVDDKDMKNKKRFLNKFVNPLQDIRCEYEGYYIDFTPDKSIKYSKEYLKNNEVMCNFEIEGTAGMPLFLDVEKTQVSQSPTIAVPVFPMIIPEGVGTILGRAGSGSRRIINNTGTVDAWFSLTLKCLSDKVEIPTITLEDGLGTHITVNTILNEDDILSLSTQYGNEFVTQINADGTTSDLMVKVTRDSELFLLSQGENTLIVSDINGEIENVEFTIEFSPLYMEVQ